MKITHRGPADAGLSKLVQKDQNVGQVRRDDGGNVGQSGESSKVNISQAARELQRIAELAREGDELRSEKLKQIKERIEKGEYKVDSEEVAKSIIRGEVSRILEKK